MILIKWESESSVKAWAWWEAGIVWLEKKRCLNCHLWSMWQKLDKIWIALLIFFSCFCTHWLSHILICSKEFYSKRGSCSKGCIKLFQKKMKLPALNTKKEMFFRWIQYVLTQKKKQHTLKWLFLLVIFSRTHAPSVTPALSFIITLSPLFRFLLDLSGQCIFISLIHFAIPCFHPVPG